MTIRFLQYTIHRAGLHPRSPNLSFGRSHRLLSDIIDLRKMPRLNAESKVGYSPRDACQCIELYYLICAWCACVLCSPLPVRTLTNPQLNQEAVERLRSYKPPPSNYGSVPLSRRAAVLLLLYADAKGDLRVVLTVRSKSLSSCRWYYYPVSNIDTPLSLADSTTVQ